MGSCIETYDSLVQVERPLSRGIQRFTGITQGMVDEAPPPDEVLPELADLLEGRVLVAHNARFDVGVLRQAFERAGLEWPKPPVLCTVMLARRFAPLAGKRGLAQLAGRSGSRSTRSTGRWWTPHVRACSARCFRGCARTRRRSGTRSTCSARGGARARPSPARRSRATSGRTSTLPDDPGVYVFRDERGAAVRGQVGVAALARAGALLRARGWTERAEIVDYRSTNSELGALVLENRLIKQWKPPGNKALKRTDRYCYLRCRLDIPYPVLEVAGEPAAGHA